MNRNRNVSIDTVFKATVTFVLVVIKQKGFEKVYFK